MKFSGRLTLGKAVEGIEVIKENSASLMSDAELLYTKRDLREPLH